MAVNGMADNFSWSDIVLPPKTTAYSGLTPESQS
jgi:hypothetical protein